VGGRPHRGRRDGAWRPELAARQGERLDAGASPPRYRRAGGGRLQNTGCRSRSQGNTNGSTADAIRRICVLTAAYYPARQPRVLRPGRRAVTSVAGRPGSPSYPRGPTRSSASSTTRRRPAAELRAGTTARRGPAPRRRAWLGGAGRERPDREATAPGPAAPVGEDVGHRAAHRGGRPRPQQPAGVCGGVCRLPGRVERQHARRDAGAAPRHPAGGRARGGDRKEPARLRAQTGGPAAGPPHRRHPVGHAAVARNQLMAEDRRRGGRGARRRPCSWTNQISRCSSTSFNARPSQRRRSRTYPRGELADGVAIPSRTTGPHPEDAQRSSSRSSRPSRPARAPALACPSARAS
jgi:hypothetical protein